MQNAIDDFLLYMKLERSSSENTLGAYRRDLRELSGFLKSRCITSWEDVKREDILDYVAALHYGREGLTKKSPSSLKRQLACAKSFYKFLVTDYHIENNPTSHVPLPKQDKKLPDVLSIKQVSKLLDTGFETSDVDLRDKAMLELLYCCGLRVSELCGLKLSQLFLDQGYIRVFGKGNKERIVPIGGTALAALQDYLNNARRNFDVKNRDSLQKPKGTERPGFYAGRGPQMEASVFLNKHGSQLSRQSVFKIVQKHGLKIGIKNLHPHTIRHSFATHMLSGGADLRIIQELLGHASINTTQIYTDIDNTHIQQEYFSAHPRA